MARFNPENHQTTEDGGFQTEETTEIVCKRQKLLILLLKNQLKIVFFLINKRELDLFRTQKKTIVNRSKTNNSNEFVTLSLLIT